MTELLKGIRRLVFSGSGIVSIQDAGKIIGNIASVKRKGQTLHIVCVRPGASSTVVSTPPGEVVAPYTSVSVGPTQVTFGANILTIWTPDSYKLCINGKNIDASELDKLTSRDLQLEMPANIRTVKASGSVRVEIESAEPLTKLFMSIAASEKAQVYLPSKLKPKVLGVRTCDGARVFGRGAGLDTIELFAEGSSIIADVYGVTGSAEAHNGAQVDVLAPPGHSLLTDFYDFARVGVAHDTLVPRNVVR